MDGWNEEELYELMEVLSECYRLEYEIKNCYRGAYTKCKTYEDLKQHILDLAEGLKNAAEACDYIEDEPEEEDED